MHKIKLFLFKTFISPWFWGILCVLNMIAIAMHPHQIAPLVTAIFCLINFNECLKQ